MAPKDKLPCVCVSVFVYACVFAQRNEVVLTVREQKWSCSFSQQKQSSDMFCDTGYVSLLTRIKKKERRRNKKNKSLTLSQSLT